MISVSPERFLLLKQDLITTACITSEKVYTFKELRQEVLITSQNLNDEGIENSDRVGILIQHNVDFVISVLALWQISAVPVPINTRLTETEINEQLIKANCKYVIVHSDLKNKFKLNLENIIDIPFDKKINLKFTAKEELKVKDPAVIIFTSGSANKSKGVILSFQSLFNSAISGNNLLRYTHSDRWLASLPFYHIGGFSIIARSPLFGIPIIIPNSLSIDDICNSISNHKPTFISLVAAQLKQIIDLEIKPNPELKNCLIGGGFSDSNLIKKAVELGWPINKVYGSTETGSFVTALLTEEHLIKPHSVGRPVPSNKIIISDESGNEMEPFEIGEILIQSNALMSGYLDSDETKKVVINGLYYSGYNGYLDEDNYLFIEGRKNYLISSGGENVNPKEVEDALIQHPMVLEAAVFPLKDLEWGEIVAATIVLKEPAVELIYNDLKTFLQNEIAAFKIPRKIFFAKSLPKTELGKVEKEKLIKRYML
jgi:O-succinylbenzoic acid--CoA ligase